MDEHLIEDPVRIREIARSAKRVAVLGIKPESHAAQPAFYVPQALQRQGVEIVPVPVYYPEVQEILGTRVIRDLRLVGDVDIVDVFRRAEDIDAHVDDMLALRPRCVWFQLGIVNPGAAKRLAEVGIDVVQNRCLMVEAR